LYAEINLIRSYPETLPDRLEMPTGAPRVKVTVMRRTDRARVLHLGIKQPIFRLGYTLN
jgi:hypothetical protein